MLRVFLALVIAAHGIGHILFLVPLLVTVEGNWGQSIRSWLLGAEAAPLIGGLIWAAAVIVFCMAAFGLWTQQPWWRTAAVMAAVISTVGLLLFWSNPPTSPVWSALGVNLTMLVALLLIQWPSLESVGV